MIYLSQNLSFLLDRDKISGVDFAEKMGWTPAAFSRYKRGKSDPPLDKLIKIAEYFSVTLDELVKQDLSKTGVEETATNKIEDELDADALRLLIRMNNKVEKLEGEVAKLKSERETADEMREKLRKRFPKQWQDIEKELHRG